MDKKYLTPSALKLVEEQEIQRRSNVCPVCSGIGTIHDNSQYGDFEKICISCEGTGKYQILGFNLCEKQP